MKSKGKLTILVVLFAGAGLLMATTAFDTVEADRTAEVETAGDASALLGLEAGDTELAQNDDGLLQITLDEDSDGEGLNENTVTSVLPDEGGGGLFTVTNNGADEIEFGIQPFEADTTEEVAIYFIVTNDAGTEDNGTGEDFDPGLDSGLVEEEDYDLLRQDGVPFDDEPDIPEQDDGVSGVPSADDIDVDDDEFNLDPDPIQLTNGGSVTLGPGDDLEVGIVFDVGDLDDDGDIFADDTITLTADST